MTAPLKTVHHFAPLPLFPSVKKLAQWAGVGGFGGLAVIRMLPMGLSAALKTIATGALIGTGGTVAKTLVTGIRGHDYVGKPDGLGDRGKALREELQKILKSENVATELPKFFDRVHAFDRQPLQLELNGDDLKALYINAPKPKKPVDPKLFLGSWSGVNSLLVNRYFEKVFGLDEETGKIVGHNRTSLSGLVGPGMFVAEAHNDSITGEMTFDYTQPVNPPDGWSEPVSNTHGIPSIAFNIIDAVTPIGEGDSWGNGPNWAIAQVRSANDKHVMAYFLLARM